MILGRHVCREGEVYVADCMWDRSVCVCRVGMVPRCQMWRDVDGLFASGLVECCLSSNSPATNGHGIYSLSSRNAGQRERVKIRTEQDTFLNLLKSSSFCSLPTNQVRVGGVGGKITGTEQDRACILLLILVFEEK
jgi:hypothetical protein